MSQTRVASRRTTAKAEAARLARRRAVRRRRLVIAGVSILLVLVTAVGFAISRERDTSTDVAAPSAGSSSYGVSVGDPDAPHSVVIYEDFLCPYCGQLESASRAELGNLAADGRVRVEYRPFNLLGGISDYSVRSTQVFAILLEESGPEAALAFHDLLYEHQPAESGPYPDDEAIIALAVRAGGEASVVRSAMSSGRGLDWVEEATRSAQAAGVRGTPTVLLDGRVFQDGRTMTDLAGNLSDRIGN